MKQMKVVMALLAVVLIAAPVSAQSRKDKKEAAKAQWEMEQQQQREEAQLRHQMKMDSLANAQKVAEQKAAKAEAERRAAEAEAKARQQKAEEQAAMQEVELNEPCMEFESTAELIRARGIGEAIEQQASVEIARSAALKELASQISTNVNSLLSDYMKSINNENDYSFIRRVEGLTMTEVNRATGYRVACRKTTTYMLNGKRIYKTYIVVELPADQLLKPIYDGIQKDDELKIDADYNAFKKEFDEHFKNQSEEALEDIINQ